VRNVFVIDPGKKIKPVLVYPMTTGRNFDEVLRTVDSLQLTTKHRAATPIDWKPGAKVAIAGSVSNREARETRPCSPWCSGALRSESASTPARNRHARADGTPGSSGDAAPVAVHPNRVARMRRHALVAPAPPAGDV
jgi:hypothetical protein